MHADKLNYIYTKTLIITIEFKRAGVEKNLTS